MSMMKVVRNGISEENATEKRDGKNTANAGSKKFQKKEAGME